MGGWGALNKELDQISEFASDLYEFGMPTPRSEACVSKSK